MSKYQLSRVYVYGLLTLSLCINVSYAVNGGEEFVRCEKINGKQKYPFYYIFKSGFQLKGDIHRSYLLGFDREISRGDKTKSDPYGLQGSIMKRTIAVFNGPSGNEFVGMVEPSDDFFYLDTSMGPASFVRIYDNRLVYAEGKTVVVNNGKIENRIWQLYDKNYVVRFLSNHEVFGLQGQLHPGKRFGPPLIDWSISDKPIFVLWESNQPNIKSVDQTSYVTCTEVEDDEKNFVYDELTKKFSLKKLSDKK